MSALSLMKSSSGQFRSVWHPQVQIQRFRWWKEQRKTPLVRRHGYEDDFIPTGLLPRSKDFDRIRALPVYRPRDSWAEKRALYGQNDYVDILGDNNVHPLHVAYQVPVWLKGFRGHEFQMLLRRQKMFDRGCFPLERPTKWEKTKKRIDWLWYHLNYRKKIH